MKALTMLCFPVTNALGNNSSFTLYELNKARFRRNYYDSLYITNVLTSQKLGSFSQSNECIDP